MLNLHGEVPSNEADGVDVLNAEERFLPTLRELARRFPGLKIVLEHCTSEAAVACVRELHERGEGGWWARSRRIICFLL